MNKDAASLYTCHNKDHVMLTLRLFAVLLMVCFASAADKIVSPVDAGLQFFKRHQDANGYWDPATYQDRCGQGIKCEPGIGNLDDRIAVTAQISLTFLGAGFTHKRDSEYRTLLEKSIAFLCSQQKLNGSLAGTIEAHAMSLSALSEAYALTMDKELKPRSERAIKWLLASRIRGKDNKPLAWGDAQGTDTELTCHAVIALRSCMGGCLEVGDGLVTTRTWWQHVWKAANPQWNKLGEQATTHFPAHWNTDNSFSGDETLAGIYLAMVTGESDIHVMHSLIRTIRQRRLTPSFVASDPQIFLAGRYASFLAGGVWWKEWNSVHKDAVLAAQDSSPGCKHGSWPRHEKLPRGRLESTAYFISGLEIYYAYYRDTSKFDLPEDSAPSPPP